METKALTSNPFTHMLNGTKKMFKTNIVPYILTYAIFMGLIILMSIVSAGVVVASTPSLDDLPKLLLYMVGLGLVMATVGVLINLVLERLVLNGVRNKKTTIGQGFEMAKDRFMITLKIALGIIGASIAVALVISLVAALVPVLAVLLMIGALVALIVGIILYAPAFILLPYVVVDDRKPAGVKDAINSSIAAAKPIRGKIWLFVLVIVVASIIIGMFTSSGSSKTVTTSSSNNYSTSYTKVSYEKESSDPSLIGGILNGLLGIAVSCGIAELYVLSRNGKAVETAPAKPVAPAAAAPPDVPTAQA